MVSVTTGGSGYSPSSPSFALGGGLSNEGQGGIRAGEVHQPLQQSGFPSTSVLDTFNRADGAIGSNWSGFTSAYAIASNQLDVVTSGWDNHIYWKNGDTPFGADQEVFVTLSQLDTDTGAEQQLLLKSQINTSYGNGVIAVLYDHPNQVAQVWTYDTTNGWVQHGTDISVTFNIGDQFGARAKANGDVEVYKNGSLLATRSVTSWLYYDDGGYIGLWFANATDAHTHRHRDPRKDEYSDDHAYSFQSYVHERDLRLRRRWETGKINHQHGRCHYDHLLRRRIL